MSRRVPGFWALGAAGILLAGCGAPPSSGRPAEGAGSAEATVRVAPLGTPHPFAGEQAWIAYQTNKAGESVWLIHPDGSDDHQVALDVPGERLHPDWSPDGTRLVLTSRTSVDTLYELDVETDEARVLWECVSPCVGDDEAVWSPDGSQIAFVRAMEPFVDDVPQCALFLGDPASGEVEQLSNTVSCWDREAFPHWSRNGTRIAYFRGVYDQADGTPLGSALYVIDVATRTETKLTEDNMFAGDSDWSAGDEWIVFGTYPLFDFQCCAVSNLYRIHPDGTGLEQITDYDTEGLRATQPRYTPDGEWLVFTSVTPSARVPWVMPADGGEPIAVATSGIFTHNTWQPGK